MSAISSGNPLLQPGTLPQPPVEGVLGVEDVGDRTAGTDPIQGIDRIPPQGEQDRTSSLYRVVAGQLQQLPTEENLVSAEQHLLNLSRDEWRLDGIPALQLFARMHHVGVPTRLLDATWNQLIASWFAVAAGADNADGRLFAFTVKSQIQVNKKWNSNTPQVAPELVLSDPSESGTGLGRRVWRPPALHSRIPAQSAVLLLDAVPVQGPAADPGEGVYADGGATA